MEHTTKTALITVIELQGLPSHCFHHTFRKEPTRYNGKDQLHLHTHWSSTGFCTQTNSVLPVHQMVLYLTSPLLSLSIILIELIFNYFSLCIPLITKYLTKQLMSGKHFYLDEQLSSEVIFIKNKLLCIPSKNYPC